MNPGFWCSHAMWRELSRFDWGQSLFKWGEGIKTTWYVNCDLIAFMTKVRISITIKRQYETPRKGEYWWKVQKMRIFSMVSLSSDFRKAQAFHLEHVSYIRHKGFWFYYLQQNPSPRIQEDVWKCDKNVQKCICKKFVDTSVSCIHQPVGPGLHPHPPQNCGKLERQESQWQWVEWVSVVAWEGMGAQRKKKA